MKLLRFGDAGSEKPGLLDENGTIRDLSGLVSDVSGNTLSDAGLDTLRNSDVSALPPRVRGR